MVVRNTQRNKITSNPGSSKSSKICSVKTLLKFIVAIVLLLFVISTHLFSIILTNHHVSISSLTMSHGIHSSVHQHKSNLIRHVNQNNIPEKEEEEVEEKDSKNIEEKVGKRVPPLPMSETPALNGAKKGTIECEVDVSSLVYWNDPQGSRDVDYVSPFIGENLSVSF